MSDYQGNILFSSIKNSQQFGSLQIVGAANHTKKANGIVVASFVKN